MYDEPHQRAWRFLSTAPDCESIEELEQQFASVLEGFGFTHYSAVSVKNALGSTAPHALTRRNGFETWDSHYWTKRYHSDDPSVGRILNYTKPFSWSEMRPLADTNKTRTMWGETGDLNMKEGFVVKVAGPQGESVMVRMASEAPAFDAAIKPILESVAIVFTTIALRLEEGMIHVTDHGVLSRREAECLHWVREGKTDWEIAAILQIHAATVNKHVQSAKSKLGAVTRQQAVVVAGELGILDCQW